MVVAMTPTPTQGSPDDAVRLLIEEFAWRPGKAEVRLNAWLADDSLRMHWRDGEGREGDFSHRQWGDQLRIERDSNNEPGHGPVDFATGQMRAQNDGCAFVRALKSFDRGCTFEFTLSLLRVR